MIGQDGVGGLAAVVVPLVGSLRPRAIRGRPTGCWTHRAKLSNPSPHTWMISQAAGRAASTRRRPTRWTCCGGSGSAGRSRHPGTRRPVARPGTSSVGCRSLTSLSEHDLAQLLDRFRAAPGTPNALTGKPSPGRRDRGHRGAPRERPAGTSTTSTSRPGRARWSTRSRWREVAAAGVGTLITTRWMLTTISGRGCSDRGSPSGSRAASPMRCSTSCSLGCRRCGTGRWSRSGCPPGLGLRSYSVPVGGHRPGPAAGDPQGDSGVTATARPPRMRSCGYGSTRHRVKDRSRGEGTNRCGGRCGDRSGR